MWASVRAYGDEATELLKRFEELCRPHRGDALPEHDLVQGNLNLGTCSWTTAGSAGSWTSRRLGVGDARTTWMRAARDGASPGVDELFLEAALRAGGRAAEAVCAEAAFASTEEFVHERSSYSRRRLNHGARRALELLRAEPSTLPVAMGDDVQMNR